jgi:hypothetical protein
MTLHKVNKQNGCLPPGTIPVQTMGATLKPFFERRWEYAGSTPTGCGSQPLPGFREGGGLVTPPGTCAIWHGFHCPYGMGRRSISYRQIQ